MNRFTVLLGIVGLSIATAGLAVGDPVQSVEWAGFADVQWHVAGESQASEKFSIGQAELDLATGISEQINLEMAIAYDPDAGSFGLGALVMDFHLLGTDEDAFHRSENIHSAGVIVGQMDVPFGIDWLFYPSIDRSFITGPLVVADTHDSWNDLGLAAYLESERVNAVVYQLNGSGYVPPDLPAAATGGEISGATGGRLGLRLFPGLEVGGSLATVRTTAGQETSRLHGLDLQASSGPYSVKGEYISQELGRDTAAGLTNDGYYAAAMYHPEKWFAQVRYDHFNGGRVGDTAVEHLCVGAGISIQGGASLRIEQQLGLEQTIDQTLAQCVVGF